MLQDKVNGGKLMGNDHALVTVVCDRDQAILELQCYSINKFIEQPCDHYIVIENSDMSVQQWHDILAPHYRRHRLILVGKLLPDTAYQNDSSTKNGWHRSALLKLLVANNITQSKYLILDSKNFFIKSLDLNDWPCAEGNNLIAEIDKVTPYWPNLDQFCKDLGIIKPKQTWSSSTPFMVKTDTVKQLIQYKKLYSMFLSNFGWSSELLLYSVFAQHLGSELTHGVTPNITFWEDESTLDRNTLENFYNWPDIKSLGLHRYAFEFNQDLSDLINWLVDLGFDKTFIVDCLNRYQQDIICWQNKMKSR